MSMLCVVWLQKELEQLLDSGAYNDAQEVGTTRVMDYMNIPSSFVPYLAPLVRGHGPYSWAERGVGGGDSLCDCVCVLV